jgi:hypothetical protein
MDVSWGLVGHCHDSSGLACPNSLRVTSNVRLRGRSICSSCSSSVRGFSFRSKMALLIRPLRDGALAIPIPLWREGAWSSAIVPCKAGEPLKGIHQDGERPEVAHGANACLGGPEAHSRPAASRAGASWPRFVIGASAALDPNKCGSKERGSARVPSTRCRHGRPSKTRRTTRTCLLA